MCIAIYSLCGNDLPTKERLQNCFKANPDGAGFAYAYKGTVYTYKGFFKFDEFYKKLTECDKKYNLINCGVLIHFRIATHAGINAANCHPFPLSSKESKLKATFVKSKYAVIHNGICSITATVSKKETLSDTALFVRDYLSKIATFNNWFDNPYVMSLVENMIDSKMAILNADGRIIATSGFHKAEDGNYYSNYSYKERDYGIYRYDFFGDDWYSGYYPCTNEEQYEMPLMELKRGECIYYDDGTIEEYRSDYHSLFKTYINEDGDVYALFDNGGYCDKIPMEHLSYIGNGIIIDNFFTVSNGGYNMANFRKDAVTVL